MEFGIFLSHVIQDNIYIYESLCSMTAGQNRQMRGGCEEGQDNQIGTRVHLCRRDKSIRTLISIDKSPYSQNLYIHHFHPVSRDYLTQPQPKRRQSGQGTQNSQPHVDGHPWNTGDIKRAWGKAHPKSPHRTQRPPADVGVVCPVTGTSPPPARAATPSVFPFPGRPCSPPPRRFPNPRAPFTHTPMPTTPLRQLQPSRDPRDQ